MKKNDITVIIPMFNSEKYIIDTLISLENQKVKNFDVIIIDDGSTDDSHKIVSDFINSGENKLNYNLFQINNKGQSFARNMGIHNSETEYISFVDSDDTVHPRYIEILLTNIKKFNADISIASYNYIKNSDAESSSKFNSQYRSKLYDSSDFLYDFLYRKNKFLITTMLIRRDLVINNNLFFKYESRYSEDQEYIWRVLNAALKIVYCKESVYNYYRRENSIMTTTHLEKIQNGYQEINKMCKSNLRLSDNNVLLILPRWIFGVLHANSKNVSYLEFNNLSSLLNAKIELRKLLKYRDFFVFISTIIFLISPKFFYTLIRKMK
jgi:glycosyltransferase involved in cell wall biosynthesis